MKYKVYIRENAVFAAEVEASNEKAAGTQAVADCMNGGDNVREVFRDMTPEVMYDMQGGYSDGNRYRIDFSEYGFCREEGTFVYTLRMKRKCVSGNWQLYMERTDGVKHTGIVYPGVPFAEAGALKNGALLRVRYARSRNGKCHIREIEALTQ